MSRARFQEGTLTIEGKNYVTRFRVYNADGSSKRKKVIVGAVSKTSKREANKLKSDIVSKATGHLPTLLTGNRGDVLFKDFYENRFLVLKVDWSAPHRRSFTYIMDAFVLPKFGRHPLAGIDKVMIQAQLNSLAPKYSQSTIKHVRGRFVEVLEEAVEQEFISRNPATKTKIPNTARAPQRPILSEQQLIGLIQGTTDKRDKAILLTGTFCAMRTSEIFGLPWGNFNEDASYFMVDQIAYNGERFKRTKTDASKARVPIGPQTLKAILEWKAICKDTSSDALMFTSSQDYVNSKKGAPMSPGTWLQKRLQPLAIQQGIPFHVNFRATRRTACSMVQEYGAAIATASSLLRHASPMTTTQIYSQVIPESVRKAVNSYEDRVFAARKPLGPERVK